jgi:hypothetical protein
MFIFSMTLFPDKQAKAQQEIDAVVESAAIFQRS